MTMIKIEWYETEHIHKIDQMVSTLEKAYGIDITGPYMESINEVNNVSEWKHAVKDTLNELIEEIRGVIEGVDALPDDINELYEVEI